MYVWMGKCEKSAWLTWQRQMPEVKSHCPRKLQNAYLVTGVTGVTGQQAVKRVVNGVRRT